MIYDVKFIRYLQTYVSEDEFKVQGKLADAAEREAGVQQAVTDITYNKRFEVSVKERLGTNYLFYLHS